MSEERNTAVDFRPTLPSIHPGSINEDQLRLGRKRQVRFIPLADERGCAGKTDRVGLHNIGDARTHYKILL